MMKKIPQDPAMCVSFVNTQLRDGFSDLDEFCREFEVERAGLEDKLSEAGYAYDRAVNRFK